MAQEFPFKREFLNPEELWQNALNTPPILPKIIKFNPKIERPWPSIPKNYKWLFMGKPTVFVLSKDLYHNFDVLTDYFTEEARMKANVLGCPNPLDFYRQNYQEILEKGQELEGKWKDHPNPRYFIREAVYLLAKECTTFKISLSKAVYSYFNAKTVLDPSSGWGDRCLGAGASGVDVYHGIDPNPNLREGYDKILRFIGRENYRLLTEDFLKTEIQEKSYQLVFTSPPYYSFETYSTDPNQSIAGRSTVETWISDFLRPYLRKAWSALCVEGYMVLYASDTRAGRFVNEMNVFLTRELHGQFLGIIGAAGDPETLGYAYPLWCYRKISEN